MVLEGASESPQHDRFCRTQKNAGLPEREVGWEVIEHCFEFFCPLRELAKTRTRIRKNGERVNDPIVGHTYWRQASSLLGNYPPRGMSTTRKTEMSGSIQTLRPSHSPLGDPYPVIQSPVASGSVPGIGSSVTGSTRNTPRSCDGEEVLVTGREIVVGVDDGGDVVTIASLDTGGEAAFDAHAVATSTKVMATRAIRIPDDKTSRTAHSFAWAVGTLLLEVPLPCLDRHLEPVLNRRNRARIALVVDT